jgi:hypothetical protein
MTELRKLGLGPATPCCRGKAKESQTAGNSKNYHVTIFRRYESAGEIQNGGRHPGRPVDLSIFCTSANVHRFLQCNRELRYS